jgi:hypothetical protein
MTRARLRSFFGDAKSGEANGAFGRALRRGNRAIDGAGPELAAALQGAGNLLREGVAALDRNRPWRRPGCARH